jgi:hypothetical protein
VGLVFESSARWTLIGSCPAHDENLKELSQALLGCWHPPADVATGSGIDCHARGPAEQRSTIRVRADDTCCHLWTVLGDQQGDMV